MATVTADLIASFPVFGAKITRINGFIHFDGA